MNFWTKIKSGKLLFNNRQYFDFHISQMKDGEYLISVEKKKNKRSVSQNRMYWGILNNDIFPIISEHTGHTLNEIHEIFKEKFLPKEIRKWKGLDVEITGSTTNLTKGGFIEFVERIRADVADMGIIIKSAEEYLRENI